MTSPIAHFVAAAAHPDDIERILGRCRYQEDTHCLVWTGALSGGQWPRVQAPNPATGVKSVTVGRRGVWLAMTGKPIPNGWRVYGTCNNPLCISPEHTSCGKAEAWGKHLQATGHFRGRPARIAANRATGQARRKVSDADMAIIHGSASLAEAAQAIGVTVSTISRYKRGVKTLQALAGNPFAGLFTGLKGRSA